MFTIKMKYKDGYERVDSDDGELSDALSYIENEAINEAEITWTGNIDKIFPAYWQVIRDIDSKIVASGFVDENGALTITL